MQDCVLCNPMLRPDQQIVMENGLCMFLQLKGAGRKGSQLEGAGIIVPKTHREAVFDVTEEEWAATFRLLVEVKRYTDEKHRPAGYNIGWNCGETAGQHIMHAHLHLLPRYEDEPLSGKGIRYLFKGTGNQR